VHYAALYCAADGIFIDFMQEFFAKVWDENREPAIFGDKHWNSRQPFPAVLKTIMGNL